MTAKTPDDLQAVRDIVEALQAFASEDRERIVRWAREKLGMSTGGVGAPGAQRDSARPLVSAPLPAGSAATPPTSGADIKSFVSQKSPGGDTQFAATVAYYYQFVAPEGTRKTSVGKEELVDACRKVDRKRPAKPAQVLVNAYHEGLLDRAEKGQYKLNSVGENLVAMVLPGTTETKRTKASSKGGGGKTGRKKRSNRRSRG